MSFSNKLDTIFVNEDIDNRLYGYLGQQKQLSNRSSFRNEYDKLAKPYTKEMSDIFYKGRDSEIIKKLDDIHMEIIGKLKEKDEYKYMKISDIDTSHLRTILGGYEDTRGGSIS